MQEGSRHIMRFGKSALVALLGFSLLWLGGCSIFSAQPVGAESGKSTAQAQKSGKGGATAPAAIGRYYDFDDIQVPNALKLDKKRSLIFRAGKFKAGVLVFTDNLEVQSLINFFIDSMQKDNWVLAGLLQVSPGGAVLRQKGQDRGDQHHGGHLQHRGHHLGGPTVD